MYPPDPGSVDTATMGGSVAECSGGLRGLKYGVTKHYIMGLEVVLADGRVMTCGGKTVKNVSGYDMVKLFVGSEGTLGIATKIINASSSRSRGPQDGHRDLPNHRRCRQCRGRGSSKAK